MKPWIIKVLIIMGLAKVLFAGGVAAKQLQTAHFILIRGYPYTSPEFNSDRYTDVMLRFGDEVIVIDTVKKGGTEWHYCVKKPHIFFIPSMFVTKATASIKYDENGNIPIGEEVVDIESSLPLFYTPGDLVELPDRYKATGYKNRSMLLRKNAAKNFMHMIDAATSDGVDIGVLSAFRTARYQSYLYTRAIRKYGVFQCRVAKPGHSEHQLGTTCDLTTGEISYRLSGDFENTEAY
ncbi:MAG: M15 family metallopeptidase, partial [Spirochaetota bacterium]